MKNYIAISLILSSFLMADGFEYKGNIGFEYSALSHDIEEKRDRQNALRLEAEVKQSLEDARLVANIKTVVDRDDNDRRYFDFNDLYFKYNFENSDLLSLHQVTMQ